MLLLLRLSIYLSVSLWTLRVCCSARRSVMCLCSVSMRSWNGPHLALLCYKYAKTVASCSQQRSKCVVTTVRTSCKAPKPTSPVTLWPSLPASLATLRAFTVPQAA
ncbi:hypothetical protein M758_6G076500 [Ceratodon purpureus]|nr:hypothetical protein M758_6G076500 [Ceratodon purpureus]